MDETQLKTLIEEKGRPVPDIVTEEKGRPVPDIVTDEWIDAKADRLIGLIDLRSPEKIVSDELEAQRRKQERDTRKAKIDANVVRACSKCCGHCCIAFSTFFDKPTLVKWCWGHVKTTWKLLGEGLVRKPEGQLLAKGSDEPMLPFNGKRWKQRLYHELRKIWDTGIMLVLLERINPTINRQEVSGGRGQEHHWTCRAFNHTEGKCTIYKYRPEMCRSYRCDESKKGYPPKIGNMMSHPERSPSQTWRLIEGKFREFIPSLKQWAAMHRRRQQQWRQRRDRFDKWGHAFRGGRFPAIEAFYKKKQCQKILLSESLTDPTKSDAAALEFDCTPLQTGLVGKSESVSNLKTEKVYP